MPLLLLACAGGPDPVDGPGDSSPGADTAPDDSGGDTGDSGDTGRPPPRDRDGDGHAEDVDCDDTDPKVYPGAPDRCDDVDQDCDGVPWAPAACAEPLHPGEVGALVSAADSAFVFRDLTGDGIADLIVSSAHEDYPMPDGLGERFGYALYAGVPRREEPIDAPEAACRPGSRERCPPSTTTLWTPGTSTETAPTTSS